MIEVDTQSLKAAAPGLLGAVGAVFFMRGPLSFRLGLVLPGAALSYYGAAYAASSTGMPEGLAGFLLGLIGMVFMGKIIQTWQDLEVGPIVRDFVRKLLGLGGGNG